MIPRPTWVVTAAFAGAVVTLTYPTLLSASATPFYRDLLFFFVPFKQLVGDRLGRGELPLWNPHLFLGMPLLANLHSGVLYPPSVLLLLPLPLGFNLFLFFHYLLALGGIGLLLRHRGLGPAALSVGIFAFVIGGYAVSMLNVTNFLQSFAWAPLVLFAWSQALDEPTPRRLAVFVAMTAAQVLAGGVEITLMTLAVLAAWTLARSGGQARRSLKRGLYFTLSLSLALGVAAVQIVPTIELVAETTRGTALHFDEVTMWSMKPVSLVQLLLPHSSSLVSETERGGMGPMLEGEDPWLASIYFGVVPLIAAVAGMFAGRERRFWTAIAVAGVVLALGAHSPVFPALYQAVPWLVGKFRFPEKFFFVTHVAVAVLAAEGTEQILRRDSRAVRAATTAALTLIAMLAAVWVFRWSSPFWFIHSMRVLAGNPDLPPGWALAVAIDVYLKAIRACVILVVFLAVAGLGWRGWIRGAVFAAILAALTAADLGSTHHELNLSLPWRRLAEQQTAIEVDTFRASRERILHVDFEMNAKGDLSRFAQQTLHFSRGPQIERQLLREWGRLFPNSSMDHGVDVFLGGDAFRPRAADFFIDLLAALPPERALRLFGALSIRYVLARAPIDVKGLEPVDVPPGDLGAVYRLADVAPRVYLAGRVTMAPPGVEAVNRVIASDFVLGQDAVVERTPDGCADALAQGSIGAARIRTYEPERVAIEVEASRPALLVLNDSHFPGWKARIDGREAKIVRANHFVRGVWVKPEDQVVEFSYEPFSLRIGFAISCISIALLGVLCLIGRPRRSI